MIPQPVRSLTSDKLRVAVFKTRDEMGRAAAMHVRDHLVNRLSTREHVRIVVGSAPSQDEFFAHLTADPIRSAIDWSRIEVFHMDEYIGLPSDHPQNFRAYQRTHLLSRVAVMAFHEIQGETTDAAAECERLTTLLTEAPIDLVCLGIGENGHLAFNDPPAPLDEREWVKIVELDHTCRQQQVNDGCFATIADVPTHAITLSMRVFREAATLSGVVPARSKAHAVKETVTGPVSEDCPATLMRIHSDASLFLDTDAASLLADAD